MDREQVIDVEKGNMSALKELIDVLTRYYLMVSAQQGELCQNTQQGKDDLSAQIDRALSDLGVPDHLLGYRYLQAAIRDAVSEPEAVHSVTNLLYPGVARRFGTTASLVERAIRHAVESGWSRCDDRMRQQYFGSKIRPGRQKPTNAEFIARIANIVRQ